MGLVSITYPKKSWGVKEEITRTKNGTSSLSLGNVTVLGYRKRVQVKAHKTDPH